MKKKRFRKVSKQMGISKKYLSGARNKKKKADEIKRTAERYRKGLPINIKRVSNSRVKQGKRK
jgi:hypothetical protein